MRPAVGHNKSEAIPHVLIMILYDIIAFFVLPYSPPSDLKRAHPPQPPLTHSYETTDPHV